MRCITVATLCNPRGERARISEKMHACHESSSAGINEFVPTPQCRGEIPKRVWVLGSIVLLSDFYSTFGHHVFALKFLFDFPFIHN